MEKMGSQSGSRKTIRRRSHTRKTSQGSVINMAEARREIAHVLHLHRSSTSSSSSSSSSSTSTKTQSYVSQEREPWMLGNTTKPTLASSYCCYSLAEALPMPVPDPVWSTTEPSVPAAPSGSEAMEFFEWGENEASSYTWWLAFLRALDVNNIQKTEHPFADNVMKENSRVLEKQASSEIEKATNFVGASDQNASLDEWLMFPTTEDDS